MLVVVKFKLCGTSVHEGIHVNEHPNRLKKRGAPAPLISLETLYEREEMGLKWV